MTPSLVAAKIRFPSGIGSARRPPSIAGSPGHAGSHRRGASAGGGLSRRRGHERGPNPTPVNGDFGLSVDHNRIQSPCRLNRTPFARRQHRESNRPSPRPGPQLAEATGQGAVFTSLDAIRPEAGEARACQTASALGVRAWLVGRGGDRQAVVNASRVPAENVIRAGQAACLYS